jgi:transposase
MARLKPYHPEQGRLLPVIFDQQIQPGTFEFAVHHLVEEMDLSGLLARYRNDETGARAYDPRALLKVVLVAYSRGILSSRGIERACRESVVFQALSADTRPHFTTIAEFITSVGGDIRGLFVQVLTVCAQEGLISRQMFAVDGCKLSANAAKEWSGTRQELAKRVAKIEQAVAVLLRKHREADVGEATGLTPSIRDHEAKAVERLRAKAQKLQAWLATGQEKKGRRGKPIQSNLTDAESAKMPSAHGVVQGYNAVAMVDEKHQVIVHAEAFGEGAEQALLEPMIAGTRANFQAAGAEEDAFAGTVLVADSGYSSEANAKLVLEGGIEAYIPDTNFRKRDPQFAEARRYRRSVTRRPLRRGKRYFLPEDFRYDPEKGKLICPAGQELYVKNRNFVSVDGLRGIAYEGRKTDCRTCALRPKCLRNPKTEHRQVVKFTGPEPDRPKSYLAQMIERIDTALGRYLYSRRMGIVEPVFAHIRHAKGMDRFTLRGKRKVDIQWQLYCLVHNIGKLMRYSERFA